MRRTRQLGAALILARGNGRGTGPTHGGGDERPSLTMGPPTSCEHAAAAAAAVSKRRIRRNDTGEREASPAPPTTRATTKSTTATIVRVAVADDAGLAAAYRRALAAHRVLRFTVAALPQQHACTSNVCASVRGLTVHPRVGWWQDDASFSANAPPPFRRRFTNIATCQQMFLGGGVTMMRPDAARRRERKRFRLAFL
jgi:hypothetical protein